MSLSCGNLYEAIERHSALLANRVQGLCAGVGWPVRLYNWMLVVEQQGAQSQGAMLNMVATTVSLPYGHWASFTPRSAPKEDGQRWVIDIRRTDRVLRGAWAEGLTVQLISAGAAGGAGQFELMHNAATVSDAALGAILEDLARR